MLPPCAMAADRLLEQPARLRIAWRGQEARRWTGRISVAGGRLSDLQLLGLDADAAGSIWIEDGAIRVAAISPHRFDGLDVTVTAGDGAHLTIELSADGMTEPAKFDVPLADALRQPFRQQLAGQTSEMLVHRAPNDVLRIETERDTLIFAPGDTFTFTVRPVLDELSPSTTIDVATTLSPERGGVALWSDAPQRLPVPASGQPTATVNVPLPNEEGVYQVRVSVSQPPGVRKAFFPIGGTKPIAERTFQLLVLQPTADPTKGGDEWQAVLDIDPANPRWWQRLPEWTQLQRLPGFAPRPLGSLRAGTVNHPLGQFVELPPTVADNEPHWQAYALPIERVGVPHVLEVEYPADREQHFGLSILEPNAAGRIVPVGRDSGVYVEGLGRAEQTSRHTHRLVFWPRTNSPLLLVTNLHPSAAAHFGRIRVLRGAGSLAGSTEQRPWRESPRLVAAYLGRPLVPELFGATEGLDAATGESADDLETFFEASERTAQYLRYAGYNAAIVNVLADGSCIYPSRRLQPTPLYDTGRIVAGTADLPDSDGLELMLRVFDREGLALVPSLQLAAPLPELERLRRGTDPHTSGLEWVDGEGRTWLEVNGAERGLAPYYNLLDERVQQAVLDVAREITDGYGHHTALAGLAVQLSGSGYAQLPGLEWGLDDATIAQFERETGVQLSGSGTNRFAERQAALVGEHAGAWQAWRAARVTRFYRRLAEQLQASGPERRLLLTTEEMFAAPRLKAQLHPNLLSKLRLEQLMLEVGVDQQQLDATPGITVCAARFAAPTAPLVDRATDLEINEALDGTPQTRAAMIFHRPQRQRLSSFDAKSGLGSRTLLVAQSSADAAAVRKPLAEVLAANDPVLLVNGGELLPMGQEDATRDILRVVQQLPTRAQVTVERQQPVVVRSYADASGTTHLVVNECPWSVDADVALDVPADTELELLTESAEDVPEGQATRQQLASGRQSWRLHLEPYGVEAARVAMAGVKVAAVRATISAAAKAELQAQLADLTGRNLTAPSKYEKLANPGFEPAGGGGPLPGWRLVGNVSGATAELDASQPASGKSCLALHSIGPAVAIESNTFATPPTGQLLMAVRVRGENLAPGSELRIIFEADRAGQPYRTFWAVGGQRPNSQPLASAWGRPFAVGVNDLPLDSKGRMRVRFELSGAGDVWIDEVQLYDVLFPLSFYQFTKEEKLEFVKLRHKANREYEDNQLADCVRSLEGYWPRFLVEYLPPVAPVMVKEPPPAVRQAAVPPEQQQPTEPGTLEKIKKWVPFR